MRFRWILAPAFLGLAVMSFAGCGGAANESSEITGVAPTDADGNPIGTSQEDYAKMSNPETNYGAQGYPGSN